MAPNVNTEFKSYLTQAENLFGQFNNGNSESGSSYGDIAWFKEALGAGDSINAIANGDDNQKAAGIKNLINSAMSLINKLASNEAKAASEEVKKNSKAAAELQKAQQQSEAELNTEIQNIGNQIDEHSNTVKASIENITKANESLEEKQEQINEIIEELQAKQAELAKATTPEEKAKLLAKIQGLSNQITEITTSITDIQAQVEDASSQVENAVTEIETAKGNAVEVQENGQMKIAEIAQQGVQQIQTNTQSEINGNINTATGQAAEKAAATASSNVFSAGAAAKLYRVAYDQNSAGTTRTSGALTNLRTVMQGIGGLQNNASLLSNFETSIGSALDDFSGCIGSWNTALEPVITSIGSFTGEGGIQESNETLQESVSTDLNSLGFTINEKGEAEKNENAQASEKVELFTPHVEINKIEIQK